MESYKFHYLCNFYHFRLMSKPDTILVLCCKVCTGLLSSIIDFVNRQKCTVKIESIIYVNMVNFLHKYCLVIHYIDRLQSAEPHLSLKFIYMC